MRFIFIIFLFLVSLNSLAESYDPSTIFLKSNQTPFQQTIAEIYSGKPIVKIENSIIKELASQESLRPSTPDELKKLHGSIRHNDLAIKTRDPFGKSYQTLYTDHTTDFLITLQILDDNSILVHEQIYFVVTTPYLFTRVIDKTFPEFIHSNIFDITLLEHKINSKKLPFSVTNHDQKITLSFPKPLPEGFHHVELKYLVKNALLHENNKAFLFYSLTGDSWNLPINRFSVIVLHPFKTTYFQNEIYFGTNNLYIPSAFVKHTDLKGNTTYSLTNPAPAFANIRLLEVFDGSNLIEEKISFLSSPIILSIIFILITFVYFIGTHFYLKHTKKGNILKSVTALPIFVLFSLLNTKITPLLLNHIHKSKHTILFRLFSWGLSSKAKLCLVRYSLKMFSFFYLSFKYIFFSFILLIVFWLLCSYYNISLSILMLLLIFAILCVQNIVFFYTTIRKIIYYDIQKSKEILLGTDIFFGLNESAISTLNNRYTLLVSVLGIYDDFVQNVSTVSIKAKS